MIRERKLRGREGGGREGNRVGVEVRVLMRGKMAGRVGKREIGRGRVEGMGGSLHTILFPSLISITTLTLICLKSTLQQILDLRSYYYSPLGAMNQGA